MAPFEEIVDGDVTWRLDRDFLQSRWTCIWGRGCPGIGPEAAPHLQHGCCSLGAELDDEDEAMTVDALARTLTVEQLQHHAELAAGGAITGDERPSTRVVDGACIFLNRPGFSGGAGCALHLAAIEAGEPPHEWKPSVCWQVPVRVEFAPGAGDTEVATVRRWERADWGDDADAMGWWCTDDDGAQVGDVPVVESLADELTQILGPEVYVELRRRLT